MTIHSKTFNLAGEKFCSKCKDYHPLSAFYKNGYICTATFRTFAGIKEIPKEIKPKQEIERDTTEQAITLLRLSYPDLKLANPYRYQRPDAYDNYLNSINKSI